MNKLKKLNKKGSDELLENIPYIILTIIVAAGVIILTEYFINVSIHTESLQEELLFNRVMYSPNSIMYTDNVTGQVYPGVIDLGNFTNATLDKAITYSYDRFISAKLELKDKDKKLVKTAYLNNVWFNRLYPLVSAHILGASSGTLSYRSIPVIYRTNGVNMAGFLEMEIILAN